MHKLFAGVVAVGLAGSLVEGCSGSSKPPSCMPSCLTVDATCGATGCDSSGACVYPAKGISCGNAACADGMSTASTCNGAGTCLPDTPTACPNNFACKDATACNTQCAAAVDCAVGFQCDTATMQCVAKQSTGPCSGNDTCASGFCGISGSGNCCLAQCSPAIDQACDPIGCDPFSGACSYPAGSACGNVSCTGGMLTAGTCDAIGACNSSNSACPGNLLCNSGGTACLTSCSASTDCVAGTYCNAGQCLAKLVTGTCSESDDCLSGICGIPGQTLGYCCTAACSTSSSVCGATGCDATGACTYPGTTIPCGAGQVCTGSTQTDAFLCDGQGSCPSAQIIECTPYVCGTQSDPAACVDTCQTDDACVTGSFCDTAHSVCCTLASGSTIGVDGVTGDDDAGCCGTGALPPCQTISRAMMMIDTAQAANVTINAALDGGGGDWPASEVYPIILGWGVELSAPGVYFLDPNGAGAAIIDVHPYSANDTIGYASITGTPADLVGVGMNAANSQQLNDITAISIESTLYLANATVNSSATNPTALSAIYVNGGGSLIVGQDQSGSNTGTVFIGNDLRNTSTDGFFGIICMGGSSAHGIIRDAPLVGQSSVVIQGQPNAEDILLFDYCDLSLSSAPVFGIPPIGVGLGRCGIKHDYDAIVMTGQATATIENGIIQCMSGTGIMLLASSAGGGNPIATVDGMTVENSGNGILASAGTATVTNSTIIYNFVGVEQQNTDENTVGLVDLSGGGNAVICSGKIENPNPSSGPDGGPPGVDVYNDSTAVLNASNVAWDTSTPDYFTCNATLYLCTCNDSSCATTAGDDGMDAVEDSTDLGGVTTTGNILSAFTLDAGCS